MTKQNPKRNNQQLERIRAGDRAALEEVYRTSFHYCAGVVLNNGGNLEEARDLFQEALMIFIDKIEDPGFSIEKSVKAFLYGVMRILWYRRLDAKKKTGVRIPIDNNNPGEELDIIGIKDQEEEQAWEEKHEKLSVAFLQLAKECQLLLEFVFYQKMSLKEVAEQMGYSYDYARQKRVRCMRGLQKLMLNAD